MLASATSAGAQSLTQTRWIFTEIGGEQIAATERGVAALQLDEKTGRAAMSAGCNNIFGSYVHNGAALTFGRMAMTKMACHGDIGRREDALLKAIPAVRGWRLSEGVLHLTEANGAVLARLVASPRRR